MDKSKSASINTGGARESDLVNDGDPGTLCAGNYWAVGAAEQTYQANAFKPAEDQATNKPENLTYTPARVMKYVYNDYSGSAADDYSVFCYFTDWAQYDDRHGDGPTEPGGYATGGRSGDIMRLEDSPFDKVVIGFAGIIGNQTTKEMKATVDKAAADFGIADSSGDVPNHENKVTFLDGWGDVLSYLNCGFNGWKSDDVEGSFNQENAQGVLGGLAKLQASGKTIALSIGGWSLSCPFSALCADPEKRHIFIESLSRILTAFPMFTHLDLDWEYPGSEGAGNPYDSKDGKNFASLIKEIKDRYSHVGISIAISADIAKIKAANIPALITAGVDGINLMSYDLFTLNLNDGGNLSHHTNLHRESNDRYSRYSIEEAVDYLLSKDGGQVDNPKKIFIGYAGYSRSSRVTDLHQVSPLVGTYKASNDQPTVGSFEASVTEWPDIIYNYLNLEDKDNPAFNDFKLYTDNVCNADFLYNEKSRVFMSIDTPRSVREKARYVKQKGLGGLFIWSGDQDNGLLTNAACEGLGRIAAEGGIDMQRFYFEGANEGGDGHVPELPPEDQPREGPCNECQS